MCMAGISRAIRTLSVCRILSVFIHCFAFFANLCCCLDHCNLCFGPLVNPLVRFQRDWGCDVVIISFVPLYSCLCL